MVLSCPHTGSECSDSVVGWLFSHQTECGYHETKTHVFFASLMPENKCLVILNHLIFTEGMSGCLYLRHPPSKRLGETPIQDGDVVCFLKRLRSVRNRTCWGDKQSGTVSKVPHYKIVIASVSHNNTLHPKSELPRNQKGLLVLHLFCLLSFFNVYTETNDLGNQPFMMP